MILIIISLIVAALYSGGMYLFYAYLMVRDRLNRALTISDAERMTFHLALCFILSVGFLGLILGN